MAGTGRILEALERFEFDAEQIEWLADQGIISEEAAQFLSSWRFTGDIWGYAEDWLREDFTWPQTTTYDLAVMLYRMEHGGSVSHSVSPWC